MSVILTRPTATNSSGTGITGLEISVINGQPTLTLEDTTRVNKKLSVAEQVLVYGENRLGHNDWIRLPGNAVDTESGFVTDLDGTIVFCSAQCENTGANDKDIHVFIDAVDQGSMGNLGGGPLAEINNTTLNLDFVQGSLIRVRAVGNTSGQIQDTVVKLTIKWRA